MAKRDWQRLGEKQRRRYERAGVTRTYYESGASLQKARGHRPHEHVSRETSAHAAGRLTSSERQWLKRQGGRIGAENNPERWAQAVEAFEKLSPEVRDMTRKVQRRRQISNPYAAITGPIYSDVMSPMLLSSRSGLR